MYSEPPVCSQGSWDHGPLCSQPGGHPALGAPTCLASQKGQRELDLSPGLLGPPSPQGNPLPFPSPPSAWLPAPSPGFSNRRNGPSLLVEIHTHSPTKLSTERRAGRNREQLQEQEAPRESGQTDGETEPRSPSVSDSRGPGGPPAPPGPWASPRGVPGGGTECGGSGQAGCGEDANRMRNRGGPRAPVDHWGQLRT